MKKAMALLLVLVATGCTAYRPTAPLPAPETTVRISFPAPRDVVVRTPAGDSMRLGGVTEIRGRVVRAQLDTRLDTVRIRLGSASSVGQNLSGIPDGAIATIPREIFVRMEQRSLDPWKTLAVVGIVAGGLLLLTLFAAAEAYDELPY